MKWTIELGENRTKYDWYGKNLARLTLESSKCLTDFYYYLYGYASKQEIKHLGYSKQSKGNKISKIAKGLRRE